MNLDKIEKLVKIIEESSLQEFRKQIYQPCKEVLDCRLVAKRLTKLFQD